MTAFPEAMLDERTRDELRPPCEVRCACADCGIHPEGRDADLIVTVTSPGAPPLRMLLCHQHYDQVRVVTVVRGLSVTAEPLR